MLADWWLQPFISLALHVMYRDSTNDSSNYKLEIYHQISHKERKSLNTHVQSLSTQLKKLPSSYIKLQNVIDVARMLQNRYEITRYSLFLSNIAYFLFILKLIFMRKINITKKINNHHKILFYLFCL